MYDGENIKLIYHITLYTYIYIYKTLNKCECDLVSESLAATTTTKICILVVGASLKFSHGKTWDLKCRNSYNLPVRRAYAKWVFSLNNTIGSLTELNAVDEKIWLG